MPSFFFKWIAADSLWRDRDFVLFWWARIISITGSVLTTVILPILVFQLTGSALRTSLLVTLGVLPYLLFGLFAGALADRTDRRRLMVGCDVVNAALLISIPVAAFFGVLSITQIYLVHFLAATVFVWFDAANFGALPALVGRERVLAANSAIWSASTVAEIVAPSVAGVLVAILGAAAAITLDAASYLLSGLALLLITRSFRTRRTGAPTAGSQPPTQPTVGSEISAGLRFIWQHRLVRTLTLLGFGVSFTGGAVSSLIIVFAVRALGLTSTDSRLGWLFTAGAIGALLASLLLPWLTKLFSVEQITLIGLFANLTLVLALVFAANLWSGLVLYLLWTAFHSLIIINGISLRQMVTPEELLSRVNVSARMIAWGGTPFGAAVGGLLAESFDIRLTYVLMASGVAVSALLGWFSPLRSQKSQPDAIALHGHSNSKYDENQDADNAD